MKTLYKFGMLAVAALAFAGCSKEVDNFAEQKTGTHTLTFSVQKDVDTRTAVVEGEGVASYVWTEGDDQYFHIYENGKEAISIEMALSESNSIATFKAEFKDTDTTTFSYTAVYGSSVSNSGNPLIPSTQTPALGSFDPAADVLVSAEPIKFEGNAKAAQDAEFKFKLKRVVSANKMTLKGLTAGEKISKVELSSDMYFSSRYGVEKETYTGADKTLVLDYSGINAVVGSDGTFPVYFMSAPVTDATFSVGVTTDKHVYSRDMTSKLSLATGIFRRFGINLDGYGEEISSGVEYTLVNSQSDLESGAEYLIVGNNAKAMSVQNPNNRATVAVTPVDNVITIDNTIDAYVFKIESVTSTAYTITDVTDGSATLNQHLYAPTSSSTSGNNYLRSMVATVDAAVWNISIDNGVASIVNFDTTKKGVMALNSDLISCYSELGSYKTLSLYKRTTPDTREDVTLSFPVFTYELSIGTEQYESFKGQQVVTTPSGVTGVVYSFYGDIGSVDENTGVVTLNGSVGTGSVAAVFNGDSNYKPAATVAYRIIVDNPSAVDYVTLDWTYPTSGDATSAGISSIDGVTVSGLGTDYAEGQSPYRIKLDNTGDFIQVKTDAAIGEVSVGYKMIGGANASTLNILESSDGEVFTAVEDLTISGSQNSTGVVKTSNTFNSDSRYVKISFTKGSNIGVGLISISKVNATPRFTVDSPINATIDGDTYTVSVIRKYFDGTITVSIPSEYSWITATNVAANSNTFNVTVAANSGVARSAILTLSGEGVESQSLVVNQEGNEPGTASNPYSVSEALEVAGALANNATTPSDVYVSGIVSTVEKYFDNYKSITYYISEDGTVNDQLEVYSGKGLDGADFTDVANLAMGDEVTIKGKLKNYGGTLEFDSSSQIVSISYSTRYTVELGSVSNGTIAASATSVGALSVVTLTATPNSGYELDKWTVTNLLTSQEITVTDNQFTMPASNVSVVASFKVKTTSGGTAQFSPNDFTDQGVSGTGGAISATNDDITFSCNKGYGTTQIRCYSGGVVTISAANGKTIKNITFSFSGSNTGGLETSYTDVSSSSWTKTLSSQARITAISVTYEYL